MGSRSPDESILGCENTSARLQSIFSTLRNQKLRELATFCDRDLSKGLAGFRTDGFARGDNVHTFEDATEDDMSAVQRWRRSGGDEELRTVRVRSAVRHGENARGVVRYAKRFVVKCFAVNALATLAVLQGKIATLTNETLDDAVEARSFVRQLFPAHARRALLARAQRPEIFCRLWRVRPK